MTSQKPESNMDSLTPGRHQRHLRNYLLEPQFQLKYANWAAAIAMALSVGLGALLWRTSQEMLVQSSAAVTLGEQMLAESRKVTEVVAMSIARDPVYGDNPALKAAFEGDAQAQSQAHQEKQALLRRHAEGLKRQSETFSMVLVAALAGLVMLLWLGTIVLTHKVAGPVYKMRRQLRGFARGDWSRPSPLRKGDELHSFFATFEGLVDTLRGERRAHLARIDAALALLPGDSAAREPLTELRRTMADTLAPDSQAPRP
jgi:nitrogen fixation/metabolism regulation signal transduction histidine kinase